LRKHVVEEIKYLNNGWEGQRDVVEEGDYEDEY
jgi:hypothetical protein